MRRESKPFLETKTVKGRTYHYYRVVVTVDGQSSRPKQRDFLDRRMRHPRRRVTDANRQKALRDRKIAQGLRQVLVWVPAERVEEIRQIAERMRKEMDDERPKSV